MKSLFLAVAIAGASFLPAFAEDAMMASPDTMTCADYTAMDHDGMMAAMETLDAGMSADDQAESGKMLNETCTEHPDMMVGDAMKMMDN